MKAKTIRKGLGMAMFAGLCLAPHQLYASATYSGGSGTAIDPYLISTPEELNQLQLDVNVEKLNTGSVHYQLTAHIDLAQFDSDADETNGNWTPIGTSSNPFHGQLDGNGFTIRNLKIILPNQSNVGLFGFVVPHSTSTYLPISIHDLTLENVEIVGAYNVGALIGYLPNGERGSRLQNLSVSGTVTGQGYVGGLFGVIQAIGGTYNSGNPGIVNVQSDATATGQNYVGGVAGQLHSSMAVGLFASQNVVGTGNYVGGLAGSLYASQIEDAHATGQVDGLNQVGGLAGELVAVSARLVNASATGNINGTNQVGGLIGNTQYGATVVDVLATGNVTGAEAVGGLFGRQYQGPTLTNGKAQGDVTGVTKVGGLVGQTYSASPITDSSATGNVTASGNEVGGLVGSNHASNLTNVTASGTVEGLNNVGGILGLNASSSVISGAIYEGLYVKGTDAVGGIAGNADSSPIKNSTANTRVEATGRYVGGIAGTIGSVAGNYPSGNEMTGSVSGSSYVGGLFGQAKNGTASSHSFARATITGTGDYVGGLIGSASMGSGISSSFFEGIVTGGHDYVGGLIGSGEYGSGATNAYAIGTVTGQGTYVGGLMGHSNVGSPLTNTYAAITLQATGEKVGDLVGDWVEDKASPVNDAEPINSYWSKTKSFINNHPASTAFSEVDMTKEAALKNLSTFDFDTIWKTSCYYPQLQWETTRTVCPNLESETYGDTLINGEILGTVVSFTTPTELTFLINPNAEVGEHFIAPEFIIRNDSTSPLRLSLHTFAETTNFFTAVTGDSYSDEAWAKLGVKESQNFALALNLIASENWLTQTQQDSLYAKTVQESGSEVNLGIIRPKADVAFHFSAKHGLAFNQALNPTYTMTFIFDLVN